MPSLRLRVWNVIKLALNSLIAIFLSYNSHTQAGRDPNCLLKSFLMNEFNPPLMTFLSRVRDLISTASACGLNAARNVREFSPDETSGREKRTMQIKETQWRVAAAICVAVIYIFVTALSGRV
jgi:hypothetical protein